MVRCERCCKSDVAILVAHKLHPGISSAVNLPCVNSVDIRLKYFSTVHECFGNYNLL